jgi:Tfp pilus assembly protein PilO
MYFLSRNNNKWYSALAQTPSHYRYLTTVAFMIFVVAVWFFGIYTRLEGKIAALEMASARDEQQCARYEQTSSARAALPALYERMLQAVEQYGTQVAHQERVEAAMMQLMEIVQRSGTVLTACSLERSVEHEWYNQQNINCTLQGSLSQLSGLLREIKPTMGFVCSEVSLQVLQGNQFSMNLSCGVLALKK